MKLSGTCVVVTGGASGIGAAMATRFATEGARAVVVADRDAAGTEKVAGRIVSSSGAAALAMTCDVSKESDLQLLVDATEDQFGPIDLFCSNAGVISLGGADASDQDWRVSLDVNVMAHVYAARILVPRMLERGGGYLLQTASAAGLLTQLGSAPYSVTKHAALALAEWLAITYGEQGLKVSVLAPQAVRTAMTAGVVDGGVAGVDGMLEPEAVADAVVAGLDAESFLILPHPRSEERRVGKEC